MPRALYLHIPFCPVICPYCNFHKMLRHQGLVGRYLDRLELEAESWYDRHPGPLDTIYFGGGTPSHLTDTELKRIVRLFERTWGWPARLETTIEADPLTFDPERLERWRALGVNRLSIGLQSTQDPVLRLLGRLHNGREGLEAISSALEAGFNVSADLITAVPGQDAARDLHALAATGVAHLSAYTLTVEPDTPFGRRGMRIDPEQEAADFELADTILSSYGYRRYEVSSHAKPGFESRHNQVYWHGEYYLALGPAAAAFVPLDGTPGVRLTNPPIKGWLRGDPPERHELTVEDFVLEMLMTGLRTQRGVDLKRLERRSGLPVESRYAPVIGPALERGLLILKERRLRATEAGLMRLNALLQKFFEA